MRIGASKTAVDGSTLELLQLAKQGVDMARQLVVVRARVASAAGHSDEAVAEAAGVSVTVVRGWLAKG